MSGGRDARAGFGQARGAEARLQRLGPDEDAELDQTLMSVGNANISGTAESRFEVQIPDAKVRTRIVLALAHTSFLPNNETPYDDRAFTDLVGPQVATLHMSLRARPMERFGMWAPTRDLVGTAAAPLTIPTGARLWGFEAEIETVGENIRGLLQVSGAAANARYTWHLLVTYQSIEPMTDAEWQLVVRRAGIRRASRIQAGGGD